jgi:hypothetical protein
VERAIREELGSVLPDGPVHYVIDESRYRCPVSPSATAAQCSAAHGSGVNLSWNQAEIDFPLWLVPKESVPLISSVLSNLPANDPPDWSCMFGQASLKT